MDVLRASTVREEDFPVSGGRTLGSLQLLWMVFVFASMQILGVFTFEAFYIISYLGLVFLSQVFTPSQLTGRQWKSVTWTIRLGFLGLCYFVVQRVSDVTQV